MCICKWLQKRRVDIREYLSRYLGKSYHLYFEIISSKGSETRASQGSIRCGYEIGKISGWSCEKVPYQPGTNMHSLSHDRYCRVLCKAHFWSNYDTSRKKLFIFIHFFISRFKAHLCQCNVIWVKHKVFEKFQNFDYTSTSMHYIWVHQKLMHFCLTINLCGIILEKLT